MAKRKKLTVHRKAHKRKGYRKDIDPTKKVRMGYIKPTRVKSATFKIKDIGTVGRGKKVIKIVKKGMLTGIAKELKLIPNGTLYQEVSARERKKLAKALVKKFPPKKAFGIVHAQVVLRKRTYPKARKFFEALERDVVQAMTEAQKRKMTAKAVKVWKGMTTAQRIRARARLKEVV